MKCELVFSVQEFLKIVPGLVLFPLSIYLAVKKMGTGVSFTYTWSISNIGERISSVVLVNEKDKPVIIQGIAAQCEGVEINLNCFKDPLILKAYEATRVVAEPYSSLSLNGKPWNVPHKAVEGNVDIFLEFSDGQRHKCKPLLKRFQWFVKKYPSAPIAIKHKVERNGMLYNPDIIRFIVTYRHDNRQMTTFIERSGFISESTGLGVNMLRPDEMVSPEVAETALRKATPGLVVSVSLPNPQAANN
jgi:hypothetical protein